VLRTPLCELLRIDAPILCAPFGPWDQVELAAAVCEAGGLGALGTAAGSVPELEAQWRTLRERTPKPFAINHQIRPFDEDAFEATLRFAPPAISFHMAVFPELIERAHAAGSLWIQQVIDRRQAERALDAGADVIVAQGGSGGSSRRTRSTPSRSRTPSACCRPTTARAAPPTRARCERR